MICVDLTRVDLAALDKQIIAPLCHNDEERAQAKAGLEHLRSWIAKLQADGGGRVYVLMMPESLLMATGIDKEFAHAHVLAVPGTKEQSFAEMKQAVDAMRMPVPLPIPGGQGVMGPELRKINGIAVIGFSEAIDKLQSIKPTPRPEFEQALAAGGDRPVTAALVPPKIFAKAVEQILLQPIPGGDKPAGPIISRGLLWMGVGIEPNLDKFSAEAVIQSASADAARTFGDLLRQGVTQLLVENVLKSDASAGTAVVAVQAMALLPEPKGDQLVLSLTGERAATLAKFAQQAYAQQMSVSYAHVSMNNLKQLGLSMLNYEDSYHQLTDHAIRDKNGKPLLSWRVAMLPYLEEGALYKEFHLDEPWDSEHNKKLIDRMPAAFQNPDTASKHPGKTRYVVPVNKDTVFPPDGPIKLSDVADGTSKTIMILEADPDHAVIWTKPDDLEIDPADPLKGLTNGVTAIRAAFCDCHVESFPVSIDPKLFWKMLTRAGGEKD
ncbi:MAG TPA: DUF1559 domain-containing protein [Pirellulales bacterium]